MEQWLTVEQLQDNLLFSAEKASALNEKIQMLDPRLYLFCGYSPTEPTGDSRLDVLHGILNFFRMTTDTIPLWKSLLERDGIFASFVFEADVRKLSAIDEKKNHLRAYLAHNISSENGPTHTIHRKSFSDWETLNTLAMGISSSEGSFYALCDLLEDAETVEKILNRILDRMLESSPEEKANLVQAFIEGILYWYKSNSRRIVLDGFIDKCMKTTYECDPEEDGYEEYRDNVLRWYLVEAGHDQKKIIKKDTTFCVHTEGD